MPVVINPQSGLAEDIGHDVVQKALDQGSAHIPLNDPEGNPVAAPFKDAQELMQQGYTQPSSEQLQSLLSHAKYSSAPEQMKAFGEGLGESLSFGVSPAVERAFGVKPEDIRGRRETGMGHTAGELTGFAASALSGLGEASLIERLGSKATLKVVGKLAPEAPLVQRVLATGVKQAAEMAMLQSTDEVAKALIKDPEQTASSALIDIGMSGLLGGVVGGAGHLAVEPLWEATKGSKFAQMLNAAKGKAMGDVGVPASTSDIIEKAATAGLKVPKELEAAVAGNMPASKMAGELQESSSRAGNKYRQALDTLHSDAEEALGKVTGTATKQSEYDAGSIVKKAFGQELEEMIQPIKEKFDPIKKRLEGEMISPALKDDLENKLTELASREGHALSPDSQSMKEIQRVVRDLPNLKTLEDLRKYQAIARNNAGDNYKLGKDLVGLLRNAEEEAQVSALGIKDPSLLSQHAEARSFYSKVMGTVDDLNDRLHVGKYWGPNSFVKNFKEMTPEDVIRRLKGSKDVELLNMLADKFPRTAEAVREYHLGQLASDSPKGLFKAMDKMSPELRAFAVSPEKEAQIGAIRDVLEALPQRLNPSGTARTTDMLMHHIPGAAGGALSMLMGHNPISGYIAGQVARELGREVPDAAKLAFLKLLASDAPMSSGGFKAMAKFIDAAQRGARATEKAVKAVFTPGMSVISEGMMPTVKKTDTLVRALRVAQQDPEKINDSVGRTGHYLPDQATSLGSTIARVGQYLDSVKPDLGKTGMLDDARQPNEMEKAKYQRALDIAQQPLVVVKSIQDGTISPSDLEALASMHPKTYDMLKSQLLDKLNDVASKGHIIPYKTQLGLSMFLGMPLNSSIMPQNVLANQSVKPPPPPQQQASGTGSKGSKKDFKNTVASATTISQSREQKRITNG